MAKSKKKSKQALVKKPTTPFVATPATTQSQSIFKSSPVYELLHYFEKAPDQWAARYIIVMSSIILKTAIGLGGFLGQGKPPMHGDFEAQRHWMELTIHLPVSEWYYFDLQYWGLDYPPLTAYHLYLLGKIGSFINPTWFALNSSRGIETNEVKFFMRFVSLLSELVLYVPAVLTLANMMGKRFNLNRMDQMIISVIIINQAHLALIDHGHFQFNSVMLGFFVYSLINLMRENYVLASIWFVSCINFKQMGLYYSTFIFVFILSQLKSFIHLIVIGLTVVLTSFVIVIPFLKDPKNLLQILIRVFPFNRGLFEDKVANFWCTANVVIKFREIIDASQLSKLALISTVGAIIPMNILLFFKCKKPQNVAPGLIYGFAGNALAFYLFSYQVHEKSILIPLLPSTLLILIKPELIDIVQWINNVGTFSLYPLLKKDGLILQYFVSNLLINWLIGPKLLFKNSGILWGLITKGSYLLMIVYHLLDWFLLPPARYPDLWVILNITISFGAFFVFWLWLNFKVYKL
ncbi:glycosyltransferase family 57 protein [Suhomyces tanzawaensis NRRL Y-17324]|uniref:Alpha-1,3-glucosyltransferase n=1 Tax=Suhomyces tanzawaensis NRRL Y-17324 TaxID=984487 RepID=A0A1E4SKT2_9ASCO|nr:glycosyltransferase family 57 protein [Suhomyces tanzawaensis NRRL Y-17324]ODV80108.1 glycosyltransferase family 57 protein [Suhomyces tanzawaensis NRRL Y-17324]